MESFRVESSLEKEILLTCKFLKGCYKPGGWIWPPSNEMKTSSGRGAYEYSEFSLFLPPLEEGGCYKFASCVHSMLFCSKQKNTTHMHTCSAITSNEPFYPPSNILLSITFPPHQLTLRTSKWQGLELAGNLMRQALARISCFWFSQTYCNSRHSRSILAPPLLVQAKTQECK